MEQKINIAEILKNCPKGMELDCTIWDNVVFEKLDVRSSHHPIIIRRTGSNDSYYTTAHLTKYGQYSDDEDCKCLIFPKGKATWEGFVPPCKFKEGDVIYVEGLREWVAIVNSCNDNAIYDHVALENKTILHFSDNLPLIRFSDKPVKIRLAIEEEKKKLFDSLKEQGYKWNPETKTLDKLPKFKVGDKIVKKNGITVPILITGVSDDYYSSKTEKYVEVLPVADQDDWELVSNIEPKFKVGDRVRNKNYKDYIYDIHDITDKGYKAKEINADSPIIILFGSQEDNYELVPNKFDITTLKPFESRVLVRHNKYNKWCGSFFSHIDGDFHSHCYKYVTIAGKSYPMCIPYEKNEHLLGTTDDCDEYFKNWE